MSNLYNYVTRKLVDSHYDGEYRHRNDPFFRNEITQKVHLVMFYGMEYERYKEDYKKELTPQKKGNKNESI